MFIMWITNLKHWSVKLNLFCAIEKVGNIACEKATLRSPSKKPFTSATNTLKLTASHSAGPHTHTYSMWFRKNRKGKKKKKKDTKQDLDTMIIVNMSAGFHHTKKKKKKKKDENNTVGWSQAGKLW